ncbi:hypothetical protein [Carboxylicivirga sp. M1479]|uniref:hypothetical protein n=1 Tax=Carboxylicivirga sp. M1479 TaxID=2594476 RepID=UPI001177655D|nr:hypothetical protein [Carboxylicivirga sp. M1479]TRX62008.1 hypothetical protein FNN09_19980 [Carboxylicivirga sp. M1479]
MLKRYLKFEYQLMASWRTLIPLLVLGLILLLSSFLSLWSGSNDHLMDRALAKHLVQSTLSSTLPALFFAMWLIQMVSHLYTSGYYSSLLYFGSSRAKLFIYCQVQLIVYLIIFLFINYIANVCAGLFFGVFPWQLITQLNLNSLLSFCLFLFAIGNAALFIGLLKPSHLIVLPFFFYWLMESWLVSLLSRKFEVDYFQMAPLSSFKAIVGNAVLSPTMILVISLYVLATIFLIQRAILTKNFR